MTDELEWATEAREATLEALVSLDLLLHNAGSDERERVRKHTEQAARDLARAGEILAHPPYELATAEPEPRLWNTIQREGLDENPWDPTFVFKEPVVIFGEAGRKGTGRTDFPARHSRLIQKVRKSEAPTIAPLAHHPEYLEVPEE